MLPNPGIQNVLPLSELGFITSRDFFFQQLSHALNLSARRYFLLFFRCEGLPQSPADRPLRSTGSSFLVVAVGRGQSWHPLGRENCVCPVSGFTGRGHGHGICFPPPPSSVCVSDLSGCRTSNSEPPEPVVLGWLVSLLGTSMSQGTD